MTRANGGDGALREYVGIVWAAGQPGERFRVMASSLAEAESKAEEIYGKGHPMSIYNEEDAARRR